MHYKIASRRVFLSLDGPIDPREGLKLEHDREGGTEIGAESITENITDGPAESPVGSPLIPGKKKTSSTFSLTSRNSRDVLLKTCIEMRENRALCLPFSC